MPDPKNYIRDAGSMIDAEQVQDGYLYPPPPVAIPAQPDQGPPGRFNISDGSDALFSMYLRRAMKKDSEMAMSWTGYAEGMIIFTGLFSTATAVLLSVTVKDIRPNLQDASAFYLARINQQLSSQLNQPQDPIPTSLSNNPALFSAPTWAVWVNGLWFLCLVIDLTCALIATLLRQWARRYLEVTHPEYSPFKRARIRTFYSAGVEDLHVPWTVETLPTLLHISLFLFFTGLAVFLFNVHIAIFGVVTTWISICVILYACITFLPIIRKNSPYFGPLSAFFHLCVTGTRRVFFKLLESRRNSGMMDPVHFFSNSMRETAEAYALELPHEIDFRALLWTFTSLHDDRELEEFFGGLVGLCSSKVVPNALQEFIRPHAKMLAEELMEWMDRTLSSNMIPEIVKENRVIICTKVIDATNLFGDWLFLSRVLLEDWYRFLRCVEFGIFAQKKGKNTPDRVTALVAQCSAAVVISNVRPEERDGNWNELVFGQLNTPKPLLHRYLSHGRDDSILLANLMFLVRRIVQAYSELLSERQQNDLLRATSRTLTFLCKFDVQYTVPELQHEFCNFWNLLVDRAAHDERPRVQFITKTVLEHTRKLFDALHRGTNDARLYPMCTCTEHRSASSVEELQFDEPFLNPDAPFSIPSAPVMIPPSPGLLPASALPVSNSVASLHSQTSVPASSSQL